MLIKKKQIFLYSEFTLVLGQKFGIRFLYCKKKLPCLKKIFLNAGFMPFERQV
jgi:hypothetical protein